MTKSIDQAAEKYAQYFEGYNFGTKDYPKLILEGLEKVAMGYYNGHSLDNILLEMEFMENRGKFRVLTAKGKDELIALGSSAHAKLQDEKVGKLVEALSDFIKYEMDRLELDSEYHRENRYRENIYIKAVTAIKDCKNE